MHTQHLVLLTKMLVRLGFVQVFSQYYLKICDEYICGELFHSYIRIDQYLKMFLKE